MHLHHNSLLAHSEAAVLITPAGSQNFFTFQEGIKVIG